MKFEDYLHMGKNKTYFEDIERCEQRIGKESEREYKRYRFWYRVAICVWTIICICALSFCSFGAVDVCEANDSKQIESGRLEGDDVPAIERCYMTDEEIQEDWENEKIEQALLDRSHTINNCEITYYCTEKYPHICNAGHPYLSYRENDVVPYVTCAVDPNVIPLGSTVMVDFGDGELLYLVADDVGGSIKGDHIDIAVEEHQDALDSGIKYATVYWCEEGKA